MADVNGDGIPDLIVADYAVFGGTQGISVLLGNGDGTFQDAKDYVSGGMGPVDVKVLDFNGDGIPDLVVSNYFSDNLSVLLGNGDGTFQRAQPFVFSRSPWDFEVIGATDGRPDFAVTNSTDSRVQIIRGGASTFYATGNSPLSIASADLRGNGSLDLVTSNRASNSVSVLLGNDDGTFRAARNIPTDIHPDQVIVGDFNGDGIPDLATANFDADTVTILLGNGDGSFHSVANFSTGFNPISLAAGDFNGDGVLDLAVTSATTADVAVLLGNGDGTFQYPLFFPAAPGGDTVKVADVNGDGLPDLVVTSYVSNAVSVLLNDGIWQKVPRIALDNRAREDVAPGNLPGQADYPGADAIQAVFADTSRRSLDNFRAPPAGARSLEAAALARFKTTDTAYASFVDAFASSEFLDARSLDPEKLLQIGQVCNLK